MVLLLVWTQKHICGHNSVNEEERNPSIWVWWYRDIGFGERIKSCSSDAVGSRSTLVRKDLLAYCRFDSVWQTPDPELGAINPERPDVLSASYQQQLYHRECSDVLIYRHCTCLTQLRALALLCLRDIKNRGSDHTRWLPVWPVFHLWEKC